MNRSARRLPGARRLVFLERKYRAWSTTHHGLGNASHQEPSQAGAAMGSHYDQVDLFLLGKATISPAGSPVIMRCSNGTAVSLGTTASSILLSAGMSGSGMP